MPQVPPSVVRERAAQLRSACADQRQAWLSSQLGRRVDVLVERSGHSGHAADFAPVRLSLPAEPGKIVTARVAGLEPEGLIAQEDCHV
jgi:threonylcarbamoyladenosine tRNA methylthiotransferase MtaB